MSAWRQVTGRRLSAILGILLLVFASGAPRAHPSSYTFVTLDLPLPQGATGLAIPQDINDGGFVVASVNSEDGPQVLVGDVLGTRLFRCVQVPFADASGTSLNDHEDVVGNCVKEPNGAKIFGFIRNRAGGGELLDVPGADHTLPIGISSTGRVVGHYYNPLDGLRSGPSRIHGFQWSNGRYETLDFPEANTQTFLRGVNQRGEILGEYYRRDDAMSEIVEHQWFIYDNGQFNRPFEPSREWQGGRALFLADINDSGQIAGLRYNGGPDWDGPILFDHGTTAAIAVPQEIRHLDVRGMNNKGQFVGLYERMVADPITGELRAELHGYVASPP